MPIRYWTPLHLGYPWLNGFAVMVWEFLGQKLSWGLREWPAHVDAYNASFARRLWDESVRAVEDFERAEKSI